MKEIIERKLILTKLKIVSEEKENGCYICDKEHSKLLLSYIEQLEKIPNKALDFIHKNSYKKGDGTIMYDTDIRELESLLKGDSDE